MYVPLVGYLHIYVNHNYEGEEGVKWELGFAPFLTGKLGLAFLGLGCLKVGMGNKILKWDWDI